MISDFSNIINWWAVLFLIGIIFLPITSLIFQNFFDRGYIFSKVLGILILSYVVFLLGSLKILPFTQQTIFLVVAAFLTLSIFLVSKYPNILISLKKSWKIFLFEEIIFLTALIFWSYVRAHEPSIHGLEKYMDFGFVNSILRSEYFPPKDMWYTPLSINYYYFGHLITAVLTKLSGINSAITYNLMIATLFAFTFTASFSIGTNFISMFTSEEPIRSPRRWHLVTPPRWIICGLLTAVFVTLSGNLHTIYSLFTSYNVDNPVPFWQLIFSPGAFPNAYWYPNATRFIPFTIHEFPLYSFVVSDLHGHVLSIPIVLTTIAILLNILISKSLNISKIFILSFFIAAAYMTNVWDGIIYSFLALLIFIYFAYRSKNYTLYAKYYTLAIVGSILFSLPFSLHFKPFATGLGIICAPDFLTSIGKLGPFIFEPNHCQRSPVWQLMILHGFWYFWVVIFIVRIKTLRFAQNDIFIFLLILVSTILIILPEFIYAKDIYPAHYRANTMFKLGYQAFIMFGISTGYIISRLISNFKFRYWKLGYLFIGSICLLLVGVYPYFAINSFYGNLKNYKGLDGLSYLKGLRPNDYDGIAWINKNVAGQPVILEAVGESYTDYGRVSTNTGLPTVLGWPVHEWLWRGSFDFASPRIVDVQNLYETSDVSLTKALIQKYDIKLVFIGELEHEKYINLNQGKFEKLGQIIFESPKVKIYQLNL